MNIGYLRTHDKKELTEQKLQLSELGCQKVYIEEKPIKLGKTVFDRMVSDIRTGDVLIVPTIYVLPLTMIQLVSFLSKLHSERIAFKSIRESILSKTDLFPILEAYQRHAKGERAMINLNSKTKGRKPAGRPKGLSEEAMKEVHAVAQLYELGFTVDQIMEELRMTSRSQVYKRLREAGIKPSRRGNI